MDNLVILQLSDNQLTGDASIPVTWQKTRSSTLHNCQHTQRTKPPTFIFVHDPV